MKELILRIAGRASDLADTQPLLALCLGAALFTVFLSFWLRPAGRVESHASLLWTLYHHAARFIVALGVVLVLTQALGVMRGYLRRSVAHFQQSHGRVTEANYNAVQTIWGAEQTQRELTLQNYYEEEITERTEFEDPTRPAILRKRIVRHNVVGNPFLAARHTVTLTQNARRKGSALYGGYETACQFTWKLKNPAARPTRGLLRFPLPATGAMYDDLAATVNGEDVLPKVQLSESALTLARDLMPGEELAVTLAFKSRGMARWYFQVAEPREIRDFTLTLNLPDLPGAKLNYPEGCMSPTDVKATADARGSVLIYRLDHAISQKGMGVALPALPQPGAATNAVLAEAERGWTMLAALLLLGLTLAKIRHAPLLGALLAAGVALGFGMLGDFSDLLLGFWGTALIVFLPLLLLLAWLVKKVAGGTTGILLAGLLLVFGMFYPVAAGLDAARQSLYLNVCGLLFLAFTARQLADELCGAPAEPGIETQPAT